MILSDIAIEYLKSGVSIIPVRLDGTKRPSVGSWKDFQSRLPTIHEVEEWFSGQTGMAVICGSVSGGLEVFDFDREAETIFPAWHKLVEDIAIRLPIVETPSGGCHVYFRCPVICGNQKIAMISDDERGPGEKSVLIESRGEGGYVVGSPSPATVHERNYPYVQVAGPVLPDIPVITPRDRLALWEAARSFDRSGWKEQTRRSFVKKLERGRLTSPFQKSDAPWDVFDRTADWHELLTRAGWSSRDAVHWFRPGKHSGGHSATLRETEDGGGSVLVVFSSNAGIPMQNGHRTLSPFGFYAETYHGGNRRLAARAVQKEAPIHV